MSFKKFFSLLWYTKFVQNGSLKGGLAHPRLKGGDANDNIRSNYAHAHIWYINRSYVVTRQKEIDFP